MYRCETWTGEKDRLWGCGPEEERRGRGEQRGKVTTRVNEGKRVKEFNTIMNRNVKLIGHLLRTQRCCHNRLDEGKLWENGRQQEGQFYFKDINHRTVHFIPNA